MTDGFFAEHSTHRRILLNEIRGRSQQNHLNEIEFFNTTGRGRRATVAPMPIDVAGAGNGATETSNRARKRKRRTQPRSFLTSLSRQRSTLPASGNDSDIEAVPCLLTVAIANADPIRRA